ncbi:MAG: sorbosone dehydrogenase family protein [Steroidobacteraceae bacterium]
MNRFEVNMKIRPAIASSLLWGLLGPAVAAWAAAASGASDGEYGPHPTIVAAEKSVIPTMHIATAKGWPEGMKPLAAEATAVAAFASGMNHPRWLYVLPNGDVLAAEAQAPAKPADARGIGGKVRKWVMKRAGSGAQPSANDIVLLRPDTAGGVLKERHVFLTGLNSPIGMALVGDTFYVADSDALLSFPYHEGDTEIHAAPRIITELPAGPINHHWTKSLVASGDGRELYVGVGSNSNAAENGLSAENERAAVWQIDAATGRHRIYASGLRNPVGLTWEPDTATLWVAVNERDQLGDHVPPDYMTGLHEGGFYGWPFSYYGQHIDDRVKPQDAGLVAKAISPDYALGAHTASLGLCWSTGSTLPSFRHGMFIGQHGSWNRSVYNGYKVVFVRFEHGRPVGLPVDVLSGFLGPHRQAYGRPVGVAMDRGGALLVADDVGNVIWRVSRADSARPTAKLLRHVRTPVPRAGQPSRPERF